MDGQEDLPTPAPRTPWQGGIRGAGSAPRGTPGIASGRHALDDETTYQYIAPPRVVEPAHVYEPPPPPSRRWDRSLTQDLGMLLFIVVAAVAGFVTWNAMGRITDGLAAAASHAPQTPSASASAATGPSATPSASPEASASAEPTATPAPVREPMDVDIVAKPAKVFVSEQDKTWCAAAAVQIVLNINGNSPDRTKAFQSEIHDLEVANTTHEDSHNGGAGPLGMVETLNQLGSVTYELKIYPNRTAALRATAKLISQTGYPVILLAWRGAHAWVMSGYTADADPTLFNNATIEGAYILDPWYPRVSSIWGPSDPPGTFQDQAEMVRNYRPWRRPEGSYPDRDGRFLAIVPVVNP